MKVLHVMYQSYPNVSGSSTRSSSIVNSQRELGITPVVLTSPFQRGSNTNKDSEIINGVKYYRCFNDNSEYALSIKKSVWTRIKKLFLILPFTINVYKTAKSENVELIHSHAMFFCAVPSILVSKLLGVPHVYEIRSDWSQNSNFKANNFIKNILGITEKLVVQMSKNLIVISKGLEQKYSKLCKTTTFIGNAVSQDVLERGRNYPALFQSEVVKLGYFGSVIQLEGLTYVLDALSSLPENDYHLLIVGGGGELSVLKEKVNKLNLKNVDIRGEVPPDSIPELYKEIDIIINYRVDEPVAHSVTPLKPLEAMAYSRLVIVSDVKGMTELVTHNSTGVVVPANSPELLAIALDKIKIEKLNYIKIAENGALHVNNDKSWIINSEKYMCLYSQLCNVSKKTIYQG